MIDHDRIDQCYFRSFSGMVVRLSILVFFVKLHLLLRCATNELILDLKQA